MPAAGHVPGRLSFDELLGAAPDDSIIWMPEVVGLKFRYFNGNGWQNEWNSLQRKSLPVAVEITLQMGTLEDEGPQPPISEEVEPSLVPEEEVAATPRGSVYRLVVDLPGSPTHRAPQSVRPVLARQPSRPMVRPVSPRRPSPLRPTAPARPSRPADEPMRPLG